MSNETTAYAYTVTIGRNVEDVPMGKNHWKDFRNDVRSTLEWAGTTSTGAWHETHDGIGEWEGVEEESHKATLHVSQALYPETVAQIQSELREYASRYRQDAIAFSVGESILLKP